MVIENRCTLILALIAVMYCGPLSAAAQDNSPGTAIPQASPADFAVELVLTPELRDRKWSNESVLFRSSANIGMANAVGEVTADRLTKLIESMVKDVRVTSKAGTSGSNDGVKYHIVPTIERAEQTEGAVHLTDIIALEWKVTDAGGNVVLVDTTVAEATGKLGNAFVIAGRARRIQDHLLDELTAKSRVSLAAALQ